MSFIENVNKLAAELTKGWSLAKVTQDIASLFSTKVDKIDGKGLSTNDYTNDEKTKLAALNPTTPPSHVHSMSSITEGNLDASRVEETVNRKFVTDSQKAQFATMESTNNKGQAGGYAPLASNGKIPSSYIDNLDILDVHEASNEATMLALSSAGKGDICVRSDYPETATYPTYILKQLPASTLANWVGINSSAGVSAVNGKVGVVSLNTDDITEGVNLYFTAPRVISVVRTLLEAGTSNVSLTYNEETKKLAVSVDGYTQAQANATFATKATTLAGYGITDGYTQAQADATFATKATTLAGYGITDGYTQAQVNTLIENAVTALVNGSPALLDTLNELATALGNDANFATTMANALASKADKATTLTGYGITNAYTKDETNSLVANADKPCFSAYRSSTQPISSSTWTKVQFNAEDYDPNNKYDSTTNFRFQPDVAGYYDLKSAINIQATNMTAGGIALYKNGSIAKMLDFSRFAATSLDINIHGSSDLYLNGSTDYAEIYVQIVGTSPVINSGSPYTNFSAKFSRS